VHPGSLFAVLGPTDRSLVGLEMQQGRMVFLTRPSAGAELKAADVAFNVQIGSHVWRIQLPGTDAVAALEVVQREPDGFEQEIGDIRWAARFWVAFGTAELTG